MICRQIEGFSSTNIGGSYTIIFRHILFNETCENKMIKSCKNYTLVNHVNYDHATNKCSGYFIKNV